MIDRASLLCLSLSSSLLVSACGSESLSFETVGDPGQPGSGGSSSEPSGAAADGGSGSIGCQTGFGGAGAGGQAGSAFGGSCGSGGAGAAAQAGSSSGGSSGTAGGGQAGAGGASGSAGSAGTAGSGAGANGGAGAAGPAPLNEYREGGYAGSQNIVGEDGQSVDGSIAYSQCLDAGGHSAFVYEPDTCIAGSLCSPPCELDSECPALAGALPAECRESLLGRLCALPCEGPSDCPEGMACLDDPRFGASCLFSATPADAGCDGGCIRGDGCDATRVCCEGLVCAPWGSCEARECLDFAWPCAGVDLPCCGTLTCRDGYCQSP